MPGHKLMRECVRDGGDVFPRYVCPQCNLLLKGAVQTATCGHRLCKSCADELLDGLDQQAAARVFGFGGLEWWNGTVEWTGLEWNGMEWTGLEQPRPPLAWLGSLQVRPRWRSSQVWP